MDFHEAFDLAAQNMAAQIFSQSPQVQMLIEELAEAECKPDREQTQRAIANAHYLARAACFVACTYRVAIEHEKTNHS